GGRRRAGAGPRRARDREPDAVPDRDLRAEPDQQRPASHRAPAAPGLVRLVVLPAREGALPRQHLLPARQLLGRPPEAGDEDSDRRGAEAPRGLQEDAGREERAHPRHGRHRVLSTLHTVNAGQAIARIVGMFDQEEEKQIRQRLAETIRWIVGQRLVPKVGGGRWAVHDILANTIRSNELIVNGEQEGKTFYDIQDVGDPYLMMTFDQALLRSYEQGIITEETAVAYSTRKSIVQRGIDQIKQKRGQKTSDVEGLRLDIDYNRKLGKR